VLLARRHDLGELALSCDNTNTLLPYIDLVNEILEDAIEPPTPITLHNAIEADLVAGKIKQTVLNELIAKNIPVSANATVYDPDIRNQWFIIDQEHAYKIFKTGSLLQLLPSRQTFLSAAELRANPAYINENTYEKLRSEVFPFTLPFDLWCLQTRTYLEHLGISQPQLFELFQQRKIINGAATLIPNHLQIDCARINISEIERKIILGESVNKQPWDFWGLNERENNILDPGNPADPTKNITGTWIAVLSHAHVMLHRTGLTYTELLQLLDVKYINPTGNVSINTPTSDCDISKFIIQNLTEEILNRIHRFIRLWRKSDCTMWELDMLLPNVHPDLSSIDKRITEEILQDISQINHLRKQFSIDWRILYSFYNNIDHNVYLNHAKEGAPAIQTLYRKLFHNKVVEANTIFPETPNEINGTIADKTPGILAAFRLKENDLNLILEDLNFTPISTLNWDVLSKIYRITVLANILNLTTDSFLKLKKLWVEDSSVVSPRQRDPFATPADTLSFAKLVKKISYSEFSILELNYLLTSHDTNPNIALGNKAIIGIIQSVREELQKIQDATCKKTEETSEDYVRHKLTSARRKERI